MKKTVLLALALSLCLSGCASTKDKSTVVQSNSASVAQDTETSDTSSSETLSSESGTVENMSYTLSFADVKIAGSYSGAVRNLLPEGEGIFTAADGGTFSGSFSAGECVDGEANALSASVYFGSSSVTGAYTGKVSEGKLSGNGTFSCSGGRTLSYEGGFADGEPSGAGQLCDHGFICKNADEENRGTYEGATLNGLAEGQGSFVGRNSENIDYSYTGSWASGLFDGEGELIYESELYYDRVGHFTSGRFTPTGMELLECLGTAGARFTLSDETRAYIEKYPELLTKETLLSSTDECDYKSQYNSYLTYPNYVADPSRFTENFMYVFNDKILYRTTITAFGDDYTVGVYLGTNTLYENPVICYFLGSASSFESANVFNLYGIPLGMTSYTNADGDEISAIALLVGAITTY